MTRLFSLDDEQYRTLMAALQQAIYAYQDTRQPLTEAAATAVQKHLRGQADAQYREAPADPWQQREDEERRRAWRK